MAPSRSRPKSGKSPVASRRPRLTPEQQAERAKYIEEKRTELASMLDAKVETLRGSEGWKQALKIASKMHNYSAYNTILIYLQKPDASLVAPRFRWRRLGYEILDNQQPIFVLAPNRHKVSGNDKSLDLDESSSSRDTSIPENDEPATYVLAGPPIPEETFDISQTTARDLSLPLPELLTGSIEIQLWDAIVQDLEEHFGYSVRLADPSELGGSNGYSAPKSKTVVIRSDLEPKARLKTLIHESGHIEMDHVADLEEYSRHQGRYEVEAEAFAFIMGAMVGVDTEPYSVAYIANWAERDSAAKRETFTFVNKASHAVAASLDRIPLLERDPFLRMEAALIEASNAAFDNDPNLQTFLKTAQSVLTEQAEIIISHSASAGTAVTGDTYKHREAFSEPELKVFKFSRSLRNSGKPGWSIHGSQNSPINLGAIAKLVAALNNRGAVVAVSIDEALTADKSFDDETPLLLSPKSNGEQEADRIQSGRSSDPLTLF